MSTRHGGYDGLEVKIMEKMTIPQKRASVYREWILSKLGNDERYYMSTLYTGIPDGDDLETALADLADGLYDDDLDDMIDLYRSAKKASAAGYGKLRRAAILFSGFCRYEHCVGHLVCCGTSYGRQRCGMGNSHRASRRGYRHCGLLHCKAPDSA